MRSFFELYKKEIRSIAFFLLVSVLIIFAWEMFLLYKSRAWPRGVAFGLSFLPLSFLPLIMLWQGYQSYRKEWKNKTVYMMMSLPRAGWQIGLSKFAASLTYFLAVFFITVIMIIFVNINDSSVLSMLPSYITPQYIYKSGFLAGIAYILFSMMPYILSQFSSLISRFYSRFRGLISIVVFVLSNYLVYRIASFIAPIFNWVPNIPIEGFSDTMGQVNVHTIYINSAPLITLFIMYIVVFYIGSLIFEKYLEV